MTINTRDEAGVVTADARAQFLNGFVLVAVAVVGIAAALRLNCLGCRGLWLDEILTAQTVRYADLDDALGWMRIWVDQTPLPAFITWLLRGLGGSEIAIRWPYAVAGILTVPAMMWLGVLIGGRRLGVTAAALLAVSPFAVYYAQEARSYSWLMLFSTLAMAFAFRATTGRRAWDWLGLAVTLALSLYSSYLGLATMAAAYAFVFVATVRDLVIHPQRERSDDIHPYPPWWSVVWTVISLATALLLFLPWRSQFLAFLDRPDLGLSRFSPSGTSLSLDAVLRLLAPLDFSGPTLALLIAGIIASVGLLRTAWWGQGLLALLWLIVPVGGFAIRFGAGVLAIWERYWSVVYPAAILLVAIGAVQISVLVGGYARATSRRLRTGQGEGLQSGARRHGGDLVLVGLMAIAMSQLVPSVVSGYARVKGDDYRAGAEAMSATGRLPFVMTAGANSPWLGWGLDYYFWLIGVDALVVPAGSMDSRFVTGAPVDPWLVWYPQHDSTPDPDPSLVRHQFVEYEAVEVADDSLPQIDRTIALLRWSAAFAPELQDAAELLVPFTQEERLGANLIPDPPEAGGAGGTEEGPWSLEPGVRVQSDPARIVVEPHGGEVGAALRMQLRAGAVHVLDFECSSEAFVGTQRVYVTAHDAAGATIATFPDGAGYPCDDVMTVTQHEFSFRVPDASASVTLLFRASGEGSAEFRDIRLREAL